jgi:hypothetical protein
VCAAGCVTAQPPERIATAYAMALMEGRLDDAYALLDPRQRPDREAFLAVYADDAQRITRAEAILKSLGELRATSPELTLVHDAEGWRVADPPPDLAPRQALERFVGAVDRRDFQQAYLLLSQSWRERYTPQRLEKDFAQEPLARERVERARAALAGPCAVTADGADFPLGDGKAVRLVKEGGAYKVAALE